MLKYKKGIALLLCVLAALTPVSALTGADSAPLITVEAPAGTDTDSMPQVDPANPPAEVDPLPETPTECPPVGVQSLPRVVFNDQQMQLAAAPIYVGESVYVSARAFCEALGCTVTWLPESNSIYVTRGDLTMMIAADSRSIWANRRNWMMDTPAKMINDTLMVPVRTMAKVFSCTINWSEADQTVFLQGGSALTPAEQFYNEEDVLWLARIINCEAGNQPMDGKVAVANVVLNRVKSPSFPNTVRGVIFDRSCGVQFTPTTNGSIYRTPSEDCFAAARLALEGYETAPRCLYFVAERSAATCWANRNRAYFGQIGGHVFYR